MIHSIIVDDEEDSRYLLSRMIANHCENVQVMAEAENIDEAHQRIIELKPELVFLDIEMPSGTAFDLLKRFEDPKFEVVFTTAYDSYALRAIKCSALDYLLKPISIEDIQSTIRKACERIKSSHSGISINHLIESLTANNKANKRIALSTIDEVEFVNTDEIIRCEADGNYTKFFLDNGTNSLVVGRLKEYELMLDGSSFIRVHNSHLVNMEMVRKYVKKEGGYLKLKDGTEIPLARRKKEFVLNQLDGKNNILQK